MKKHCVPYTVFYTDDKGALRKIIVNATDKNHAKAVCRYEYPDVTIVNVVQGERAY